MPKTESHSARLADLEQERDEAQCHAREARETAKLSRSDRVRELTGDLAEFHSAINFRRPEATVPEKRAERERELTVALLDAIRADGLTLVPTSSAGGAPVLLLHDPTANAEQRAAEAEVIRLQHEIGHFARAHAAELEAERARAEADRIREAMGGDDPDAMRDALLGPTGGAAFTTRDLPGIGTVHRRG